jgi:hypothetical protein
MNLRNRKRGVVDLVTFQCDLEHARLEAGNPSYADMSKTTILSKPTITRMLNGVAVPTWRTVDAFLTACGKTPDEIEAEWKPRWVALKKAAKAAKPSTTPATTVAELTMPSGMTCPDCGCWVTDRSRHAEFHKQYMLRPARGLSVVSA